MKSVPFMSVVDTACMLEQIAYDTAVKNGTIGELMQRPECDENGNYRGPKCIPGGM